MLNIKNPSLSSPHYSSIPLEMIAKSVKIVNGSNASFIEYCENSVYFVI